MPLRFLVAFSFVAFSFVAFGAAVALAESPWTIAPTFSAGYAWTDGERDYVGDLSYPDSWSGRACHGSAEPSALSAADCYLAPTFSVGALATRVLRARLVWTASIAATAGATHRFTNDYPNAGLTAVEHVGYAGVFTPDLRIGARLGSTLRVRLGARRRGFVGGGVGFGVVADVARAPDGTFPFGPGIDPDATVPIVNYRPPTRGFTAEGILEGGIVFAPQHLSLSLLLAAGRPLARGELVLAIPFAVGH